MNNSRQDPLEVIRELADGLGANVAIEAWACNQALRS